MKARCRNACAIRVKHVVQQHAVIGLGHFGGHLHGAAGQANFVAHHAGTRLHTAICPQLLNGVGVFNLHLRPSFADLLNGLALDFGLQQGICSLLALCLSDHVSPK